MHNFTFSHFARFGENLGLVSFVIARAEIQKHTKLQLQLKYKLHQENTLTKFGITLTKFGIEKSKKPIYIYITILYYKNN